MSIPSQKKVEYVQLEVLDNGYVLKVGYAYNDDLDISYDEVRIVLSSKDQLVEAIKKYI